MNARVDGPQKLADAIRKNLSDISSEMSSDIEDARHSGVTADDLSRAIMPLLPQIKRLSELQDPQALRCAQDVLLDVAEGSTAGMDGPTSSGYGDRPSDKPCDDLLYTIVEKRSEHFDITNVEVRDLIKRISEYAKHLDDFEIKEWFPRSLDLLRECEYSGWYVTFLSQQDQH